MADLDPASLTDRELLLLTYTTLESVGKRVESHGKRITALENWRNVVLGGAAVVAVGWKLALKALKSE